MLQKNLLLQRIRNAITFGTMHRITEKAEQKEKDPPLGAWQSHTNIHFEHDARASHNSNRRSERRSHYNKYKPTQPGLLPPKALAKSTNLQIEGSGASSVNSNASMLPPLPNGPGGNKRRSTLNIDPKHFVIGSSPKRDVIGGSHYSRAILIDGKPLTQGPPPDNLKYLLDVDHLFFKPCKKFPPEIKNFNPKNKRGIWNAGGRCVYYVGQTNSYTFKKFRSGFTYEVVDYLGRQVLTSQGSQWNFGLRGIVSVTLSDGFLLGTMEQDFLGSNYNIKDGQGRIVLSIQAPCYGPAVPYIVWCFNEEFEICTDDGISEIGKISRSWDEEYPDFNGDLGIEFESSDDNRLKALLLGVFFLIEFQYFKSGGNGIAYFIVLLIVLSIISFVLSNGFGYFPQINSFLIIKDHVEFN